MSNPEYLIRGGDGRDYPADRATLIEWAQRGHLHPNQMVFSYPDDRWLMAQHVPVLRDVFASQRAKQPLIPMPVMVGILLTAALGVIGLLVERPWEQSGSDVSPTEVVEKQLTPEERVAAITKNFRDETEVAREVTNASVRVYTLDSADVEKTGKGRYLVWVNGYFDPPVVHDSGYAYRKALLRTEVDCTAAQYRVRSLGLLEDFEQIGPKVVATPTHFEEPPFGSVERRMLQTVCQALADS